MSRDKKKRWFLERIRCR